MTISTSADVKAAARRVLEDIFPADDEAALVDVLLMRQLAGDAPVPSRADASPRAWATVAPA